MSRLLQMPPVHRCAEAMWTEEDFKRRESKGEKLAAWALIVGVLGGFMWSLVRLIGWAIRISSRFQ